METPKNHWALEVHLVSPRPQEPQHCLEAQILGVYLEELELPLEVSLGNNNPLVNVSLNLAILSAI